MEFITNTLWTMLIQPWELFIRMSTVFGWMITQNVVFGLFIGSMILNLVLLPFWLSAERKCDGIRKRLAAMSPGMKLIRTGLSGSERRAAEAAYRRIRGVAATDYIVMSLPVILEIPFFLAGYAAISNISRLSGTSWWIIRDMGAPDALLSVGSFTINVLPILMFVLNVISGLIYGSGRSRSDVVRSLVLAGLFLVLLWEAPAALVLYWCFNQLFSIARSLFERNQNKFALKFSHGYEPRPMSRVGRFCIRDVCFVVTCLMCFVISVGLVILFLFAPSLEQTEHSLSHYVMHNFDFFDLWRGCAIMWFGVFFVWAPAFYLVFDNFGRTWLTRILMAFAIAGLVNFIVSLNMSESAGPVESFVFTRDSIGPRLSTILFFVVFIVILVLSADWLKAVAISFTVFFVSVIVSVVLAGNIITTVQTFPDWFDKSDVMTHTKDENRDMLVANGKPKKVLRFAKGQKNVLYIFLDRAFSGFVPYLDHEHPEITAKLDGFVSYQNTVSLGNNTKLGSPSMFGGYEYSPFALNERSDVTLAAKHDEALTLMPRLFSDAGYQGVVMDPPFPGYSWFDDFSCYADIENMSAFATDDVYNDFGLTTEERENFVNTRDTMWMYWRISPCTLSLPDPVRNFIFDNSCFFGNYGMISNDFLSDYAKLRVLSDISSTDSDVPLFSELCFSTTHEPTIMTADMSGISFDGFANRSFVHDDGNGNELQFDNMEEMHYDALGSSLFELGHFFDWMRAEGVYDDTRIVIVSDHGHNFNDFNNRFAKSGIYTRFAPLFMVKDFGSTGSLRVDKSTFMVNADSAAFCLDGIVDNPRNPATGNSIVTPDKSGGIDMFTSMDWTINRAEKTIDLNNGAVAHTDGDVFDIQFQLNK